MSELRYSYSRSTSCSSREATASQYSSVVNTVNSAGGCGLCGAVRCATSARNVQQRVLRGGEGRGGKARRTDELDGAREQRAVAQVALELRHQTRRARLLEVVVDPRRVHLRTYQH